MAAPQPLPTQPPAKAPAPLRLPTGSVRAMLALILCGTLWYLVLNNRAVPDILVETSLLVVAFYFGVRSTAPVSGAAPTTVRQPLYLPRGAIRGVLLVGFFAVIVIVWQRGESLPAALLLILQILGSYVSGYIVARLLAWRMRSPSPPIRAIALVRNLISVGVLAVAAFICLAIVYERSDLIPSFANNALAWIVAFYFGSRLVA